MSLLDRTEARRRQLPMLVVPHAVVAGGCAGVIVGVFGELVAGLWWTGIAAAVAVGVAVFVLLPRTSVPRVVAIVGGRAATAEEFPRYANLIEGLAITTGDEPPELKVVESSHANLAVVGEPGTAVMVATTGLLAVLDRVELEGVLAEGMARIRSNDAILGAHAARLVCGPLIGAGPRRPGSSNAWTTMFSDARARRLRTVLGPQREFLADLAAVDMTRYPPGLGSALEKMSSIGTHIDEATWGTAHLWLASPLVPVDPADERAAVLNERFTQHEPLEHRIDLMAEL